MTGYSATHISDAERGRGYASAWFIRVLDRELETGGTLIDLLPAALDGRERERQERAAGRRAALPLAEEDTRGNGGEDDVNPINRRGLLGAGAGAALGLGATSVPASARQIDPDLVAHWDNLLDLLGRHDAVFGAHDVLATVRHELKRIAEHRELAHGDLRTRLMRVESRWSEFASWLSNETGRMSERNEWTKRALHLAQEAGYRDMSAFARMRQSQWAVQDRNPKRAVLYAEAGLRVDGANQQTRTLLALKAAQGHALAGDTDACERRLADAYALVECESPAPPWAGSFLVTSARCVPAGEGRARMWLKPSSAVSVYERILRDWPRDRARDGGSHQARLALACAGAGEYDRAQTEGRKALVIARSTKSSSTMRELKQLGQALRTS